MRDKIEQLQADIERGVTELVDSEDWRQWLRVAARFPRYSFRNTLLIRLQRPDATAVMGYRGWQAVGHQVRKGEQSISILAPCTYKTKGIPNHDDEDDDPQKPGRRVLRGFRVAHVFDIAQTDGDAVKPPAGPTLLEGEAPAGLWDTLADQVRAEEPVIIGGGCQRLCATWDRDPFTPIADYGRVGSSGPKPRFTGLTDGRVCCRWCE